jgi:hypothetical protein
MQTRCRFDVRSLELRVSETCDVGLPGVQRLRLELPVPHDKMTVI